MTDIEKILPPSKYIKEGLSGRGLTQADLAVITGRSPSEISTYLAKEKISVEFAKELAHILGQSPQYWISLEAQYKLAISEELDQSLIKRNSVIQDYPLKDMQKRGWVSKTDNFDQLIKEIEMLCKADTFLENNVHFKRTNDDQKLNPAEEMWLNRAIYLAKLLPDSSYNENRFEALLDQLKKLIKSSKAVHKIAELLQRYGIRFVVVEPLPKARIDGAAFWLSGNRPVVAVSLRFDNIGSFWHALMHEIMHIKNKDAFSLDNFEESSNDEMEERANKEAASFLINQEKLNKFIKAYSPYYSTVRINQLATQLEVHPGIIVGQLQFRKEIDWRHHHAAMAKVRELATMTAFTDGWGHPVPVIK